MLVNINGHGELEIRPQTPAETWYLRNHLGIRDFGDEKNVGLHVQKVSDAEEIILVLYRKSPDWPHQEERP